MNLLLLNKLFLRSKIALFVSITAILLACIVNYFTVQKTDYVGFILLLSYGTIGLDMQQTRYNNFIDVHHILYFPVPNLQKLLFLARNSFLSIRLLFFIPSIILMAIFQPKMLIKILPILLLLYILHSLVSTLILFYTRRIKKVYFLLLGTPAFIFGLLLSPFMDNTLGIVTKLNSWFLNNYYGICFMIVLLIIFLSMFLVLRFKHMVRNRPFINYKDFHKTYMQW